MTNDFSGDDELAQLREHGIALFARRVIFDARPPMTAAQVAALQALCAGPLPPELLSLWRLTAGGRIDYDLHLRMNGNEEAGQSGASSSTTAARACTTCRAGSSHEREGARRKRPRTAATPGTASSRCCPSAASRTATASTPWSSPAPTTATCWPGSRACRRAWAHEMHEDGMTTVAHDLRAAFEALQLDEDPLAPAGDYFTGQALLEYLDERHQDARPRRWS